jgi:hypothetical protein
LRLDGTEFPSISPSQLYERLRTASSPLVLDVRREPAFREDETILAGALRWAKASLVGIEHPSLYRVQSTGCGELRLSSDNKNYAEQVMPPARRVTIP